MNTAQATAARRTGAISGLLRHRWARIGLQVLLVVGFSALTAAAKKLHPSVGIPGSSALYWLTALVVARSVTRWTGAGMLIGIGVAVWGVPFGLENSLPYNIGLYGISGLALDVIARLPKMDIRGPLGAIVGGLAAHMVKYGFIVGATMVSSLTRHFLVVGLVNSALLHAGFGIAAGILGWAIVRGVQLIPPWRKS